MSRAHPKPPRATMLSVIRAVAEETGISEDAMGAARARGEARKARDEVWRRLMALGFSHSAIARGWGFSQQAVQKALNPPDKPLRSSELSEQILAGWPDLDAKLAERAR